jgi:hypothetical protein
MGFRSTFVTDDSDFTRRIPDWFRDKYRNWININGCLSSRYEGKRYGVFSELEEDIQKILKEHDTTGQVRLVWLDEDGGIDKVTITANDITTRDEYQGEDD